MNPDVVRRITEFCELASLYNDETDEFLVDNSNCTGPELTKPFEAWHIANVDDWNRLMDQEMDWLAENKANVSWNITYVDPGWFGSCNTIRMMLFLMDSKMVACSRCNEMTNVSANYKGVAPKCTRCRRCKK